MADLGLVTKHPPRFVFRWLPCWPSYSMHMHPRTIRQYPVRVRTPSPHLDELCRCVSAAAEEPGLGRGGDA